MSFAHPREVLMAIKKLACDHFGSNTWDLSSDSTKIYYNLWRSLIKDTYDLDRRTRRYLADFLANDLSSIKTDILIRYNKFARALDSSPSHEVRSLVKSVRTDRRTVTGRNMVFVEEEVGKDPNTLSRRQMLESLGKPEPVPEGNGWVPSTLDDLLATRLLIESDGGEDDGVLEESIMALCLM